MAVQATVAIEQRVECCLRTREIGVRVNVPHSQVGALGVNGQGIITLSSTTGGNSYSGGTTINRGNTLNFASGGVGSFNQLCAELLKLTARIDIVHVPYKGGGPAVTDLLGGQVEMLFTGAPVTMPHIKAGKLKVIAVTDSKRAAALPEVPTIGEALPGYEFNNWYGVMAPVGTARPIVDKLNAETASDPRK